MINKPNRQPKLSFYSTVWDTCNDQITVKPFRHAKGAAVLRRH